MKRLLPLLFLCCLLSAARAGEPALLYALPSGPCRYERPLSPWFVDCAVTRGCVVSLEIFDGEERLVRIRKKLSGSGLFRIAWDGTDGRRALRPGTYHAEVSAAGEAPVRFEVEVRAGRETAPAPEETGALLPGERTDAALWACLTAPVAVVDIEAERHQRLYEQPDPDSAVVGHVHGQSQAVEIVRPGRRYTLVRAFRHEDSAPVEGYVPTRKLKTVRPNPRMGLVIDKTAQTLTVYEAGRAIGRARVSTGLPTAEKANRETRTGAFLTTDRLPPFTSGGLRCEYPIRMDGGNLIHQIGRDGADFSAQRARLGSRASEGCVRVDCAPTEGFAIDARWLWLHVPYRTKVLVLE